MIYLRDYCIFQAINFRLLNRKNIVKMLCKRWLQNKEKTINDIQFSSAFSEVWHKYCFSFEWNILVANICHIAIINGSPLDT